MRNLNFSILLLSGILLTSCAPTAEKAEVLSSPVSLASKVDSLNAGLSGQGKLVLFRYDETLDWMDDVCRAEKASGVLEQTRNSWMTQAIDIGKSLNIYEEGLEEANLRQRAKSLAVENDEEQNSVDRMLGMLNVVRSFNRLLALDCSLPEYRDRLTYMKTRLLSLGGEQDELYKDKERLQRSLQREQKIMATKAVQKIAETEASFPSVDRFSGRLESGIQKQRESLPTLEQNYLAKYPTLVAAIKAEDSKIDPLLDKNGAIVPVRYMCAVADYPAMRDQLMEKLEKELSLKLTYRCAQKDEWKQTYKLKVNTVLTTGVKPLGKLYGPFAEAQSLLTTYEADFASWSRGERDSVKTEFCAIVVPETYANYEEERLFCNELGSFKSMRGVLAKSELKLCDLTGEKEDSAGDDPLGILSTFSTPEKTVELKQQCVLKFHKMDTASKSSKLGDDWLHQYASRPIAGQENLENYFIAGDGNSSFNFESYASTGKIGIEIFITQNVYSSRTQARSYQVMKYVTSESGQISDIKFNGNSLSFTLNLRDFVEVANDAPGPDAAPTKTIEVLTGEKIEFDLDMTAIGGVAKLQGDAWFVDVKGKRTKGAAKDTLDS